MWIPREVEPEELPELTLDASASKQAMADDEARLKNVPAGRWVDEMEQLYATFGRLQVDGRQPASTYEAIYHRIKTLMRTVRSENGYDGLWALRARAVRDMWKALDGRMPEHRQKEVLGNYPEVIAASGMRSEKGKWIAPRLTVIASFKVRWNDIHRLQHHRGLSDVELLAHYGWAALHSQSTPMARRLSSAQVYADLGGARGYEAWGILAYQAKDLAGARKLFEKAQAKQPNRHVRNYLRYVDARLPKAP